jgi:hypothetical protein
MKKETRSLLLQVAIAVLAWILPSLSTLTSLAENFRKGMLATIVAGVLLSSLILLGIFGGYKLLLFNGLSNISALFITLSVIGVFSIVVCVQRTRSI